MGESAAVAGGFVGAGVVFAAGVGVFATGAFTFAVSFDGEDCATGGFTVTGGFTAEGDFAVAEGDFAVDGTCVLAGAAGGGDGAFTADDSVCCGAAGGGTGSASCVKTADGGGLSVLREHALSPRPTTAIRQIRVHSISVTPSSGRRSSSGPKRIVALLQVVLENH